MPLINMQEKNELNVALCSHEAFIHAIKEGNEQFLKDNYYLASYYEFQDEKGNSLLHYAVESGNQTLVNFILKDGVNPNITNLENKTPLHLAATSNKPLIISALVNNKANINARDKYGNTPLLLACGNYKNRSAIRKLLKLNADITLKNYRHDGPLATLAFRGVQKFEVKEFDELCLTLQLLMNYGAKKENFRCEFTFDHFVVYGKVNHVATLINAGAYLESRCHKHTPLLRAASSGKADIVELLIQRGANKHAATSDGGETALHLAVREGHVDTIQVLLVYGSNPNTQRDPLNPRWAQNRTLLSVFSSSQRINNNSQPCETPLHLAARQGNIEIVNLLLNAGAEINALAKFGTPLDYAIDGMKSLNFEQNSENYKQVIGLLAGHGANSNMHRVGNDTQFKLQYNK